MEPTLSHLGISTKEPNQRVVYVTFASMLLALALFFINAIPDSRSDQRDDSFHYISLASSLLGGEGYQSKHWMPGFSVLLTGFSVLLTGLIGPFGLNWAVLKLAMVSMAVLGVIVSYQFFRSIIPPPAAVPLALALASTPLFFDYAHRILSEIPALTSTMIALVTMEAVHHSPGRKDRNCWAGVLILGSPIAVLIRG